MSKSLDIKLFELQNKLADLLINANKEGIPVGVIVLMLEKLLIKYTSIENKILLELINKEAGGVEDGESK